MAVDDPRRDDPRVLQASAWRGNELVALLNPRLDRPPPSATAVARQLDLLRARGTMRAVTGALTHTQLDPFLANGFEVQEHLHLLRHDLHGPTSEQRQHQLRRARRLDRRTVLAIDAMAFDTFWTLDRSGLIDAIRATPTTRFRVCQNRGEPISGYAVTGLAADRGYLQRLAVDPRRHRSGIGRSLVADALHWLRRSGAKVAVVNTQTMNTAAYELYISCGFVLEANGLTVLSLDLQPAK